MELTDQRQKLNDKITRAGLFESIAVLVPLDIQRLLNNHLTTKVFKIVHFSYGFARDLLVLKFNDATTAGPAVRVVVQLDKVDTANFVPKQILDSHPRGLVGKVHQVDFVATDAGLFASVVLLSGASEPFNLFFVGELDSNPSHLPLLTVQLPAGTSSAVRVAELNKPNTHRSAEIVIKYFCLTNISDFVLKIVPEVLGLDTIGQIANDHLLGALGLRKLSLAT